MLNDESFARSQRGADVEGVEEAVFTGDGSNESQRRPKESMMRSQAAEDDEGRARVDVFDAHHAALWLQQRQTVDSVTISDRVNQRGEKGVFGEKGPGR